MGFPIRTSPAASGCTRLTGAFRSVPRPSSALDAKASPMCPYSLFSASVIRRTRHSRVDTSGFVVLVLEEIVLFLGALLSF